MAEEAEGAESGQETASPDSVSPASDLKPLMSKSLSDFEASKSGDEDGGESDGSETNGKAGPSRASNGRFASNESEAGEESGDGAEGGGEPEEAPDPRKSKGIFAEPASDADEVPAFMRGSGAPEQYADFALPEGIDRDFLGEKATGELLAEFKERELSQEEAQHQIDEMHRVNSLLVDRFNERAARTIDSWERNSRSQGLYEPKVAAQAKAALAECDPDGSFEALLDSFGLDRHPAFIRMASKAGEKLAQSRGTIQGGKARTRSVSEDEGLGPMMRKSMADFQKG